MKKILANLLILIALPVVAYQEPLSIITSPDEFHQLYPEVADYQILNEPTVARFFVVRHGENEANAQKLLDGRTLNLPLTNKGKQDAIQAGRLIASKISKIDLCLCSHMIRTQQTAQGVLESFQETPPMIIDPRLIERFLGIFEGQPESVYIPYKIKGDEAIALLPTFQDIFDFKEHPSMENFQELYDRMSQCLLETAKNNPGKNILITTHSGSLRSLYFMGTANQKNAFVPSKHFKPTNGCILLIESDGKSLVIKAVNGIDFRP